MTDQQFRLALSVSVAGLLGGCATSQPATLSIRNVGDAPMAAADESAIERGKMLLARGQSADAISAFRTALRQEQDSAEAHNGLAIAYDRIGRKDLARRYFELAYAEKPHVDRYRNNLARHFEKSGQPELARGLADISDALAQADLPLETAVALAPEPVIALAEPAALPADAIDSQIETILADFVPQQFPAEEANTHSGVDKNASPFAPIQQRSRTELAVYRPIVATAIEAVPINLPTHPSPQREPMRGTADFVADLPRNDRRTTAAGSPYIERVSLGEVKLVTISQPKADNSSLDFHLSDRQIAQWIDEERRKEVYQENAGLRGRLAIQNVVERIAVEEAIKSAASLATLVEQMDKDFVYIAFDDVADSTAA